ncbi:MAG: LytR/AlgR family response regulator transcription factor [Lachnospiraceae bacterium]
MAINIAIVEDELEYSNHIKEYLHRYEREYGEIFHITVFRDGDEIAIGYKSQFDIILMDIQMQFMDGMQAAEKIREVDSEVIIIFITNMTQYAIKGYQVDALDYVLKPIDYFSFSSRLERAIARMKNRVRHYITITVKGGTVKLDVSDVFFIESQRHNLVYHAKNKEYETTATLKETEEKIGKLGFCRVNKGCLINLEHVDGVWDGCARVNGENIPISRARKNLFMEALTNYVSEVIK